MERNSQEGALLVGRLIEERLAPKLQTYSSNYKDMWMLGLISGKVT